jgi:hypothetical protein
MPTALSDPSPALYLILVVVTLVTGAVWFRNRTRSSLINFGLVFAVLVALFLIDWFVESPREQAVRRVQAMVDAANARSPEAFVAQVSPSFNYRGADRERLRTSDVWQIMARYNVRVAVWDFAREDFKPISDSEIEIGFLAKGEADGKPVPKYVRTRFVRDPDGEYRLRSVAFYDPVQRTRGSEETIQHFP